MGRNQSKKPGDRIRVRRGLVGHRRELSSGKPLPGAGSGLKRSGSHVGTSTAGPAGVEAEGRQEAALIQRRGEGAGSKLLTGQREKRATLSPVLRSQMQERERRSGTLCVHRGDSHSNAGLAWHRLSLCPGGSQPHHLLPAGR